MLTMGSLFSGGGGWEAGLVPLGFQPLFATEFEPWIARQYAANFGDHVIVGDVADLDARRLPKVDLLVTSPPCQRYSRSGKAAVTRHGMQTGKAAVCKLDVGLHSVRIAKAVQAKVVLLEEVPDYAKSSVFADIKQGLTEVGYSHQDERILEASHYGSPTMRKRLIMRASRRPLPPWPKASSPMPWFPAVQDLVPAMPQADLAPWQVVSLQHCPPRDQDFPLMLAGGNPSKCRGVTGKVMHHGKPYTVYKAWKAWNQPGWTIQAAHGSRGNRVVDAAGRVRSLTVPAMGRLQGFPPEYRFPRLRTEALHIIGNSVPPPMVAQVAFAFIPQLLKR